MGFMEKKPGEDKTVPDVLLELESTAAQLHRLIEKRGRPVFARYPLTFALLGTLGAAAVIYGFEGVVEKTPILSDRPILILSVGLLTLLLTGTLYRYLRR